jgi:hypothetical protein
MAPVATEWRVLRWVEERPAIWRVAANISNEQWWRADKRWSSSLEDGQGADNSSPEEIALLQNRRDCLGDSLMFWFDLNSEKRDLRFGTDCMQPV